MPTYVILQVPYHERESEFLQDAMQTAAKAYRDLHERSTAAADVQTYPVADDAPYLLIKEDMDDHRSTPARVLGSMF